MLLEISGSSGNFMQQVSITLRSLGMEVYSQGQTPYSISQRITPNDQMSAFESYMSALRISGAMQMGEPTMVWAMSPSLSSSLQKPKSASFITPSLNKMLVGLRSLCRILAWQSAKQACLICQNSLSASGSGTLPLCLMNQERVPPSQYSQTRQMLEVFLSISLNLMMLGWLILASTDIQTSVNSDSLGSCLNTSMLITFTANSPASSLCWALQTLPYCPDPISSCSTQFIITRSMLIPMEVNQLNQLIKGAQIQQPLQPFTENIARTTSQISITLPQPIRSLLQLVLTPNPPIQLTLFP